MIIETQAKKKIMRRRNDEANLQAKCFQYIWNEFPYTRGLFFSVLNENTQSKYESKKQQLISGAVRKSRGVVQGVSDSLFLCPRGSYHGACIEFKTETGRQSEAQVRWQQLVKYQGFYYVVVRSLEDFKKFINWYLSL